MRHSMESGLTTLLWHDSQVVRQKSAKLLFVGAIPTRASNSGFRSTFFLHKKKHSARRRVLIATVRLIYYQKKGGFVKIIRDLQKQKNIPVARILKEWDARQQPHPIRLRYLICL